jgi:hypothetical protein
MGACGAGAIALAEGLATWQILARLAVYGN